MTTCVGGTEGYGADADVLVTRYEGVAFADVHRDILHLLPTAPSRILDIGAGTGRDAAAFAGMGHVIVAVEPTAELRAHGQRLHHKSRIHWIDDSLPDLDHVHEHVQARGELFDLIMLTGVWMHLDASERERGMGRVADLLRPGGLLIMQLRHGPAPPGRRTFEVSAAETRERATHHGLTTIHASERPALLSSSAVRWSVLAFRAQR